MKRIVFCVCWLLGTGCRQEGLETTDGQQVPAPTDFGYPSTPGPSDEPEIPEDCPAPIPDDERVPGATDLSFGCGRGVVYGLLEISDLTEQTDGRILYTGWADVDPLTVCRLHPNGLPDLAFGVDGCARPDASEDESFGAKVLVHADLIYAAGNYRTWSGGVAVWHSSVARFTGSGNPDTTFGIGGRVELAESGVSAVSSDLLVSDDHLLVAGSIDGRATVTRLNLDGTRDATFGSRGTIDLGDGGVRSLIELGGERFIAATRTGIHAFHANGERDLAFGGGTGVIAFDAVDLVPTEDGFDAGIRSTQIVRCTALGDVVEVMSILPGLSNLAAMARSADGRLILAGSVNAAPGADYTVPGIGRRLANGEPDPSFGGSGVWSAYGHGVPRAIFVLRDGRYLLSGTNEGWGNGTLHRVWN